jgi:hypothetical protein
MSPDSLVEDALAYCVGNYECELSFNRCSEPHQRYPIYNLELTINGHRLQDFRDLNDALKPSDSLYGITRALVRATREVLDQWCCSHPHVFLSFCDFDCDIRLYRIYRHLDFFPNGRLDTFLAYVSEEGKRVVFKGMLNLLAKEDFWVNDIWRFTKMRDYYEGEYYTPVDALKDILSSAEGVEVLNF